MVNKLPKNYQKLTKIVATVGPASFNPAVLRNLINSGVDVFRLNASHGTLLEHKNLIKVIRRLSATAHKEVAVMLDLPGPKARLGILPQPLNITRSHKVALIWNGKFENKKIARLPVPKEVGKVLKKNEVVAIDDGKVLLKVIKLLSGYALASVISPGVVSSRKGIAVLGLDLPVAFLTPEDLKALELSPLVDYVAISFVKTASDLQTIKRKIANLTKGQKIKPAIVAKIETASAIKNIAEIIQTADAVMVARGDLGLATDPAHLPLHQKKIVQQARLHEKPVVVATQMLDSMTANILPTRAELSDVANAVIDHADAVMLSGETASGRFPKEAVSLMARIAEATEAYRFDELTLEKLNAHSSPTEAFVHMLATYIKHHKIRVLVNENSDYALAKLISKHRLEALQIIPTKSVAETRQWSLVWGALGAVTGNVDQYLLKSKLVRKGEYVLFIGVDSRDKRHAAYMRVSRIGD